MEKHFQTYIANYGSPQTMSHGENFNGKNIPKQQSLKIRDARTMRRQNIMQLSKNKNI